MSETDTVRFPFGRNWAGFLERLDDDRVSEAERSLVRMIGAERLAGARFLDVGSGSGLFSLAAMRLGASRVHSFDYDEMSVACTRELRRRFFPDAQHWTIEQGSALDETYLAPLGTWDIVYSWGVLHHTGAMWKALELVGRRVEPGGALLVAIYNDQGPVSRGWKRVKQAYNRGPVHRFAIQSAFFSWWVVRGLAVDMVRRRWPLARYRDYRRARGMSSVHDWKDWLGGYPFEVAKPEEIIEFFQARGFALSRLTTCGGKLGCNEYLFIAPRRSQP